MVVTRYTDWRKSTRSGQPDGYWCVEAGRFAEGVAVRDTKARGTGPVLEFDRAAFARFLGDLKNT